MSTLLYYPYFAFCFLLSLLPFWLLYFLSDLFYFPLYYLIRYRRRVVRRNLETSFPEKSKAEIIAIEKKFYSFFCDYALETLKLLSISKKNMKRRMRFEGMDELHQTFAEGRSAAAYLGHYCNWEWISSLPLSVDEGAICGQIYHRLRNAASDRLFLHLRGRMGAMSIPMNETLRQIITLHREDKRFVIGFIADQSPKPFNIHHWTNFLNQETPVFTGTERIVKKAGLVTYYAEVTRPKRGYYVCRFKKLVDNPKEYSDYEITDLYMRELEAMIRREPAYWLWSHKRWKWTPERFHSMFEQGADGRVRVKKEENE
ncbi:lysophospholipid acyltransferase family protein [Bacteroides sp. OttesenSCG-928-F21]|nr:lysophospholipid acyltransferase family protein [Bacteroides sp. OttesenSCG-928-F21]